MAKVVVKTAVPLAPTVAVAPAGVTFAVPMVVLPSLNVTAPVGPCVVLLWEPMVTDKVTCWFGGAGFGLAATEAAVAAGATVRLRVTAGLAL